jgi:hypothetical protein
VTTFTIADLEEATSRFFKMHWNEPAISLSPPSWLGWHEFHGSVPNFQNAGCYALFEGRSIVYVGLGASKGGGLYTEHGISRRLLSHVLRRNPTLGKSWYSTRPPWEQVTAIYTIGFNSEFAHLSPALESFLIRELGAGLRNARV